MWGRASHCFYLLLYVPNNLLHHQARAFKSCHNRLLRSSFFLQYHQRRIKASERFGLEETFKGHLVQPTFNKQGHLTVDKIAQSPGSSDLKYFHLPPPRATCPKGLPHSLQTSLFLISRVTCNHSFDKMFCLVQAHHARTLATLPTPPHWRDMAEYYCPASGL